MTLLVVSVKQTRRDEKLPSSSYDAHSLAEDLVIFCDLAIEKCPQGTMTTLLQLCPCLVLQ